MVTEEEYLEIARMQAMQESSDKSGNVQAQQNYYNQGNEKGLVEAQLDVESIKETIYHLLRQDTTKEGKDKKLFWESTKDAKRTLTDEGVDKIMQIVNFYINKNSLLSNFDEKQINRMMLRFIIEINDLILLKYQVFFRQPTFEECKAIIMDRIADKQKLKVFAQEILGQKPNEAQIKKELMEEIEHKIEKEIQKVREEQRKEKLREYGILMAELETIVYATLNRALRGEERGSIRRHTNISEIFGKSSPAQKRGGMLDIFKQ